MNNVNELLNNLQRNHVIAAIKQLDQDSSALFAKIAHTIFHSVEYEFKETLM